MGDAASEPDDVLAGLPEDLARVLRDQSIIVPQDAKVWELLASWQNAPSNTASADLSIQPNTEADDDEEGS